MAEAVVRRRRGIAPRLMHVVFGNVDGYVSMMEIVLSGTPRFVVWTDDNNNNVGEAKWLCKTNDIACYLSTLRVDAQCALLDFLLLLASKSATDAAWRIFDALNTSVPRDLFVSASCIDHSGVLPSLHSGSGAVVLCHRETLRALERLHGDAI